MFDSIRLTWLWRLALLLLAGLPPATGLCAESGVEDKLKAGFLLNFTKYTEWPASDAHSHDLLICGIESQSLSGQLETLRGRRVAGRVIRVLAPARPSEWAGCQMLFIDVEARIRPETVLRMLGQAPVLTVSDAPGFIQAGGMIGLKLRGGRIRFEINQGAARESGLVLSSQLLKLADTVLP